jgi:hypothetical protein
MYMMSLCGYGWWRRKIATHDQDFADGPNGCPNGGRIVCARCVSWEGHVEETPELQLHGMQHVHGRVSLVQYTLCLLCKSYKHLDTLGFGTVLASYCFLFFFLITSQVQFFGDCNLINMGLILFWII